MNNDGEVSFFMSDGGGLYGDRRMIHAGVNCLTRRVDIIMERHDDDNRIVFRSLTMIMQFGLNMIVPIGMMCALGIWLDRKLGTSFFTIVLFAAGAVAGGQNIYRMAKNLCSEEDKGRDISGEEDEDNRNA